MKTILEISNLSKDYKNLTALDNLNVKVEKGMVFGILGPNGSGKTTTLGILLGVLNASSGTFSWFENGTADTNRQRIGALLETPNFFPYLSAVQNLRIVAKIKGLDKVEQNLDKNFVTKRIESVLKTVELYERRKSKFKTFSLGMKQRLAIASALLSDPEVLVLDEPTNGLDPQGIAEIRSLIKEISKDGKTILIASHALDEIEKVCTDVVILKRGVAIRQSGVENVVEASRQVVVAAKDMDKLKVLAVVLEGVTIADDKKESVVLNIPETMSAQEVNQYFFDHGIVLSELKITKKSLEAQFLEITQE